MSLRFRKLALLLFLSSLIIVRISHAEVISEIWPTERFGKIHLTRDLNKVQRVFIFFSDSSGWGPISQKYADLLAQDETMVIGISTPDYLKVIMNDGACRYLVGEIVRLGQSVQSERGIPNFLPTILSGIGQGSLLARETFNQYANDFRGGLFLDIEDTDTPLQDLQLCPSPKDAQAKLSLSVSNHPGLKNLSSEIKLQFPEGVQMHQSRIEETRSFIRAYFPSFEPPQIQIYPLIFDIPRKIKYTTGIIFISGDGGWAEIDDDISSYFKVKGYGVIGVDTLKFFWRKKNPTELDDLLRSIMKIGRADYGMKNFLVIGFSLGADVSPFMVSGLDEEEKKYIRGLVLLNAAKSTDFEIHIADWLGVDSDVNELPLLPEMKNLHTPLLCVLSDDQDDTVCKAGAVPGIVEVWPGDHHYNGEYEKLARRIEKFLINLK